MKNNSNTLIFGYLSAIAATLFWSGNFTIARGVTENIPPISLAYWRWMTAIIILTPFALKSLISDWVLIKKHYIYLSITSILGVSLFNTLIYIAGHSTTAINMSLIAITFPIFIIIISRFIFNELIALNKGAGIFLVIGGVILLITKGDLSILKNISFVAGDLWMLLAAISFALYSILLKQKPVGLGTRSFQLSTFAIGLVFLTPFYIWESFNTSFQIQEININIVYSILYLGIFASLFSYILWGKAVEFLGPTKSSMIYYTLPIFSGIFAYLLLGEKIENIHLLSMLLILAGVLTAVLEPKKKQMQ